MCLGGIKASVTWNSLVQKYWISLIQTHVDKYSTYIAIIWNENKNPRSSLSPVHKDIHAPPPPPTPHHRHHHHGHQGLTCTQGHPCSSVHHDLANASTSQRAGCNLGTWKVKMVKMFRIVKIILGLLLIFSLIGYQPFNQQYNSYSKAKVVFPSSISIEISHMSLKDIS